ncbi:RNA-directed DNA polymerase [Vibrio parahaemolyticus]|nr:RNA-directed DNA polymerase [Vibrio parahaemolyticus]HBC0006786.1 RNA-directed DNA polymerase [Vibrio parahaemolyticus]HBC0008461.1 RNA-directed DNA polymerase [Vibrio parahaemolyticus]HBN6189725.1 RNA-directed DNA polymerase [Vibrio parahaemolyticus]HBN6190949.1 RNA-directed DNA polymerase [Vibrio parahaemolyticus]
MNAAPLLVSFSSMDKFIESFPHSQVEKYQQNIQLLYENSLPPAVSAPCLAVLFGYSTDFVYALSKNQYKFYRTFQVKHGKKLRTIHSPRVALKVVQKWLGYHLSSAISFDSHVCGFIKGRSFVDAAKMHEGAKWVYSVDIADFFPSVSSEQVTEALVSIGYLPESAELIANLCSLDEVLPQGSPASPVLSNLVMRDIDRELLHLAGKHGLKVTRYADDIVFSGRDNFIEELPEALDRIFEQSSFSLNRDKTFFADAEKGQRLKVHGLLVKEDRVVLTKGYRNKIRAFKHMLAQGKVCKDDMPRLQGHMKFSEFIESKNTNKK